MYKKKEVNLQNEFPILQLIYVSICRDGNDECGHMYMSICIHGCSQTNCPQKSICQIFMSLPYSFEIRVD